MSANTIITSIVTGGTNSHTTVAEEANSIATDFVATGVVGAITLNTGSGGDGSFCVNADATPDMGVTVKAGQAYISATPSSQDAQVLRARASSDYTAYTINANSSGSTKYDWIYLSVDATKANNPASDASDVTSIVTSRSSSNVSDNGSPPTYGLLLAVVTVANGASSITNSNITDKRVNTSIGSQNGSLIVTQQATGDNAIVQAAGVDSNVPLQLIPKGTGAVEITASQMFSAYRSTSQTISTSLTKVQCNTELFDIGSNYDNSSNFRFTAPINGYYLFRATMGWGTTTSLTRVIMELYKNGSDFMRLGDQPNLNSSAGAVSGATIIKLTASDYIEIYLQAQGTSFTLASGSGPIVSSWSGCLLGV